MSLAAVGEISIPRRALQHRYVREAQAIGHVFAVDEDRIERVIGTDNKQSEPVPQLYGWAPNVAHHRDSTGFVYFTPLTLRYSCVCTRRTSLRLRRSTIYRLHDHAEHWTHDSAPVVCLFIGPYTFPCDSAARARLQAAAVALATLGRDAPRVSKGFRVPLKREVWAWNADAGTELVSVDEARAGSFVIARCAMCERFAVSVDKFFPTFSDHNRCHAHLHEEAAQSKPVRELECA